MDQELNELLSLYNQLNLKAEQKKKMETIVYEIEFPPSTTQSFISSSRTQSADMIEEEQSPVPEKRSNSDMSSDDNS